MAAIAPFTGFPQAGLQFLHDLAAHNEREWFNARKPIYQEQVEAPALSLVVTLGERLRAEVAPGLTYDTRTNGAGSLMRIYRDTRFSPDKTPYKTHVDMWLWEGDAPKKMQNPGFGVRVAVEAGALVSGLMVGLGGFDKDALAAYREAVAGDDLGPALVEALDAVKAAGDYRIEGVHYKRVPRGYDAEHARADLLRYNGLHVYSPPLDPALLTSAAFVDAVVEHCAKMAPVHHWLVKMLASTG